MNALFFFAHTVSPYVSAAINLIALTFVISRLTLKYSPPATRPGSYAVFRQFLTHTALTLGKLDGEL